MNVSVTDISPSQKKIHVEVPASQVQKEIDDKYRDLAKKVKIKGFRPGKVPRSIIKSYYGKAVEQEVSSQFIEETYPDALKETNLKPLTQADVSESRFEENGSFSYTALVDICPPFEQPNYRELKIYKPKVEIGEELVDAEMDRLRQGQAQLRTVEEDRPIKDGDVAVVDFVPSVGGQVFEKGKTQEFMAEIGKGSLHPDFDKHLLGHRKGDNFTFELDYAENTPTPEIAGKRVRFDLTVKDLKEKELPELNDEFAQSLAGGQFDSLDALKAEILKKLQERETERSEGAVREQIIDKLLKQTQFELSPRVVEREADRMIENLKHQFESQGLQFDTNRFNAPEYRTGYRAQAERDIRTRLVLDSIAKAETIDLDYQETEEIYADISRTYRVDLEKVKSEYADSALVEQAKERKLEEKVLKFIESEAVLVENPEDAREPEAEAKAEEPAGGGTEQE